MKPIEIFLLEDGVPFEGEECQVEEMNDHYMLMIRWCNILLSFSIEWIKCLSFFDDLGELFFVSEEQSFAQVDEF